MRDTTLRGAVVTRLGQYAGGAIVGNTTRGAGVICRLREDDHDELRRMHPITRGLVVLALWLTFGFLVSYFLADTLQTAEMMRHQKAREWVPPSVEARALRPLELTEEQ
jgi:hypothetical protein